MHNTKKKKAFSYTKKFKSYDPKDEKVKFDNSSLQWCPLSPEECTRDARKKNFPYHVLNFISLQSPSCAQHAAKNRFVMHEKL